MNIKVAALTVSEKSSNSCEYCGQVFNSQKFGEMFLVTDDYD